jgi:hypothetical protein
VLSLARVELFGLCGPPLAHFRITLIILVGAMIGTSSIEDMTARGSGVHLTLALLLDTR